MVFNFHAFRRDYNGADKLLEVTRNLIERYNGKLSNIHEKAVSSRDLEIELKSLGKGFGDVTVGIFLSELRDIWDKAQPNPTNLIVLAAENLGLIDEIKDRCFK